MNEQEEKARDKAGAEAFEIASKTWNVWAAAFGYLFDAGWQASKAYHDQIELDGAEPTADAVCECGHKETVHRALGHRACRVSHCLCDGFEPATEAK